jgi:hypothetical protein
MSAPVANRPRSHAVTTITVTFDRIGPIRPRLRVAVPTEPMVLRIPPHTARDAAAILRYIAPLVQRYAAIRMDTRPRITGHVDTTGHGHLDLDGGASGSAVVSPAT